MIGHIANLGKTQSTTNVTTVSQEAALVKGQERLSSMSDGQTLRGKVMSVTEQPGGGRMAQVDLGDGAMVNARLSGNMALSAGQDISFSVKNTAEGAVTLRPLYANTAADSSVTKALSQAGLPANTELTAMVREMMSEGMPIDRSSLMSMTKSRAKISISLRITRILSIRYRARSAPSWTNCRTRSAPSARAATIKVLSTSMGNYWSSSAVPGKRQGEQRDDPPHP